LNQFVPFEKLEASPGAPSIVVVALLEVYYYYISLPFTLALPSATAAVLSHASISIHGQS